MPDSQFYVAEEDVGFCDGVISRDDSTPLVVVIPGLTSDSTAAVSPYDFSTKLWFKHNLEFSIKSILGIWATFPNCSKQDAAVCCSM